MQPPHPDSTLRATGYAARPHLFTSPTCPRLDADTGYTYTVVALDAAGNASAPSAAASATTGHAPPPATPGQMIGTDPRKDPIYFVLTARFYDGDTGNDRGGNQDVASGNAADNDPMFRGDFKGPVQKLDYVRALGFSAIWITPVVLNRSDYDYHGHHGWDFYRVDPHLEPAGASYQDLINAAQRRAGEDRRGRPLPHVAGLPRRARPCPAARPRQGRARAVPGAACGRSPGGHAASPSARCGRTRRTAGSPRPG